MEDGTEFDVTADQRDIAHWEIQPFGCPFVNFISRATAFFRYVAWNAARRQGLTKLDWEKFDAQCVYVRDSDTEEDAEAEDPGTPVAPATTSSSSPTG
jgi:hypothetical protein